jgi:transcriptional regulator with XRE-family HTH domain
MAEVTGVRFEDWEARKLQDPEFAAAAQELEPGYQIARLRILRGLSQAQLAELAGTRQPSIARLENGNSLPSLSFLQRLAAALGAKIEMRLIPNETSAPVEQVALSIAEGREPEYGTLTH